MQQTLHLTASPTCAHRCPVWFERYLTIPLFQEQTRDELAYNAVIYSDGKRIEYPRANNISAALVGAGGALLLDEKGYASAFIADDSDYYTVVDEAVLLTVDDGDDRAEFYMSGKQAKYKLADGYNVSDGDEGSEGVILLDGDDFVFAFISGEDEYSVEYGILTEAYSSKAVFIIDGDEEKYELDCSLSATLIGASGKILINDYGEVTAFIPEGSGGSVIKGAVLLDNNSTSDSGKKNSALFYVNGAKVWYERAGKLNNSLVGCSGSVVLDEDGLVIEFITDGDEYSVEWGHLVALSGSKGTFYIDDDIEEIRLSGTISPTSVGSYGIILLDGRERVVSFVEDSSEEGYTLGAKGILLSANDTAADGRTKVAKLYTGGAVVTVKVSERIKESNVGLVGYLLLDEDGSAVDFIEDDTNVSDVLLVSADTGTLVSDDSSYRMSAGIPVIYDGELTSWVDVCDYLAVYTEIAI